MRTTFCLQHDLNISRLRPGWPVVNSSRKPHQPDFGICGQYRLEGRNQLFVGYIPKAQSIMARSTQDHIHTCLENDLIGIT